MSGSSRPRKGPSEGLGTLRAMFMNPGGANVLGVPIGVVILGVAIVGFVVGIRWFWRIARGREDPDARAERYRDRFD
jgi:hypothetical protein